MQEAPEGIRRGSGMSASGHDALSERSVNVTTLSCVLPCEIHTTRSCWQCRSQCLAHGLQRGRDRGHHRFAHASDRGGMGNHRATKMRSVQRKGRRSATESGCEGICSRGEFHAEDRGCSTILPHGRNMRRDSQTNTRTHTHTQIHLLL